MRCCSQRVRFTNADLSDSQVEQVVFRGGIARKTTLVNARLIRADLEDTNFMEADLSTANVSAASLHGANLTKGILHNTHLDDSDLTDATLIDTDARWSKMPRATLRNAKLTRARLGRADCAALSCKAQTCVVCSSMKQFSMAHKWIRTRPKWTLIPIDYGRSQISDNLSGTATQHKNFANAVIWQAQLARRDLTDADFTHADLNGSQSHT